MRIRTETWLAALSAAIFSLPGLWLPFLSDDWIQVESVGHGTPYRTPFDDFRPLYMLTFRLEALLFGASPALHHASNLVLIAAAGALVVALVRHYLVDDRLAFWTGLLFAIHPQHVENAAWIAARGDPLFCLPYVGAMLSYDRWRAHRKGIPLLALSLFEGALLAKETAVSLPLVLLVIGWSDARRRPPSDEWKRGLLPLLGVAVVHFVALRPWFLGGPGRTLTEGVGVGAVLNLPGLAAAAILPVSVELLVRHAALLGIAVVVVVAALLAVARGRSGSIPGVAMAAAALFAAVSLPYAVGFQARYLFAPAAPAALFLASIIRAARGRVAAGLATLVACAWIGGATAQWMAWREAAHASRNLVADLCRAAETPGIDEIAVVNMPHRVHGGSVAGDFRAALAISGCRALPVRTLLYVSYPDVTADPLDGPWDDAVVRSDGAVDVHLRIPPNPYWRLVGPRPPVGQEQQVGDLGSVRVAGDGRVRVRVSIPPDRRRAGYLWVEGRLKSLF